MGYAWFSKLRLGKLARKALKQQACKKKLKIGQVVGEALLDWYDNGKKPPVDNLIYTQEQDFQVIIDLDSSREEYEYFLSDFHKGFHLTKIEIYSNIVYEYLYNNSQDFKKHIDSIRNDIERLEDGDVSFLRTVKGKDILMLYGRIKEKEQERKRIMKNRRKRDKYSKA